MASLAAGSTAAASSLAPDMTDLLEWVASLHAASKECGSKMALVVTGGGMQAVTALFAVPGASASMLDASVPYAQACLTDYLGGNEPAQYCSAATARDLSMAAFLRAVRTVSKTASPAALLNLVDPTLVAGVSCTAALATNRPKKGKHHCFVACTNAAGASGGSPAAADVVDLQTQVYHACFVKGARSRLQEDAVASSVVLHSMGDFVTKCSDGKQEPLPPIISLPITKSATATAKATDSVGDDTVMHTTGSVDTILAVARGDVDCACYLRAGSAGGGGGGGGGGGAGGGAGSSPAAAGSSTSRAVGVPGLAPPPGSVILSGSFNPIHKGHVGMLEAAVAALVASTGKVPPAVVFELSIANADKPTVAAAEVLKRVQSIVATDVTLALPPGSSAASIVVPAMACITRVPLFSQKATVLKGCHFTLGYDTAVRLLATKYYGSHEAMVAALLGVKAQGCSFIVAGRFDAKTQAFKTLSDMAVPPSLSSVFELGLTEAQFRTDLSSTQIRAATEQSSEAKL